MKAMRLLAIAGILSAYAHQSFSQSCSTLVADPPSVSCGTGTLLAADNTIIGTDDVYYYDGSSGTFANTTINGGTLVICGTVTFNGFSFYSGNLVITEEGNATFDSYYNSSGGTDHHYYNYGSATYNISMTINGAGRFVYNGTDATLTINGSCIVAGGLMVNDGTVVITDELRFEGSGEACLGAGSSGSAETISNDHVNAVSVPEGIACISYSDDFWGNQQITEDSSLHVCQQPGALDPGTHGYAGVAGNAVVTSECSGCSAILPVTLVPFTATSDHETTRLTWETAYEKDVLSFIVERGDDASRFEKIGEVAARNEPSTYTFNAGTNASGRYFRLKMADRDGSYEYSKILLAPSLISPQASWTFYPNPVPGHTIPTIGITTPVKQLFRIKITDALGKQVYNEAYLIDKGSRQVILSAWKGYKGLYFVGLYDQNGHVIGNIRKVLFD